MRIVCDTDILSTFARIHKLGILKRLFDGIIIPPSVASELKIGKIMFTGFKIRSVSLNKNELKTLAQSDPRLGRGEKECIAVARARHLPLASNDRIVHELCTQEDISYFSLPRILRHAIHRKVISRKAAKEIVTLIETEENTTIKNKEEIFR